MATDKAGEQSARMNLVMLSEAAEKLTKLWAAGDRLWTTQETVEFNLRTFARAIIAAESSTAAQSPPKKCRCAELGDYNSPDHHPLCPEAERVVPPEPASMWTCGGCGVLCVTKDFVTELQAKVSTLEQALGKLLSYRGQA